MSPVLAAGSADGAGERTQEVYRCGPAEAAVGKTLTVDQRLAGRELLRACNQVALNHDADNAAIARGDLSGNVTRDHGLAGVVLAAVGGCGGGGRSRGGQRPRALPTPP